MKSKHDFDEFIRGRMQNVEAEGQPEGWDLLADRLSKEEEGTAAADEKLMEAVVFEKMSQMEAPFEPAHWNKLETRLNEEYRFVNKIIRYKSLELSLFLLLIALFVNYYPENTSLKDKKVPLGTPAIASDIEIKETTTSISNSTGQDIATSESSKRASKTEGIQAGDLPTVNIAESNSAKRPTKGQIAPKARAATMPIAAGGSPPSARKEAMTDVVQPEQNTFSLLSSLQKPSLLAQELNALLPEHQSPLHPSSISNSPISKANLSDDKAGLDLNLWAALTPVPGLMISPYTEDLEAIAEVTPSPRERFVRFGVQGSSDYNRVITPPTFIDGKRHELDRYALGYSGGITFSWGNKKWEMESGLIYSAKKYLPLPLSEIDYSLSNGISGEELKSFEYDMVSIPLNFRHHFIPNGKWRFYYTVGVSMHTVMQADYFLKSPTRPQPVGPPSNFAAPIPPNNNNTKAGVEKSAFTKGLLQGGAFEQNTFFTANLGIGLERYISHRTSLFAQPQYQHTVLYLVDNGGVGPFQDKINTMRLIFGMRVKL
ncbi:MAG: PorT family protein [Saprospiraceae bacterium]|nr:PorT family protein [Saprospiraceae bacterium]